MEKTKDNFQAYAVIPTPQRLKQLSHADLYNLRAKYQGNQEAQDLISAYEHRAFAREAIAEDLGRTLPIAAGIPAYHLYKQVTGAGRSNPSLEQVKQGFIGVGEGLKEALTKKEYVGPMTVEEATEIALNGPMGLGTIGRAVSPTKGKIFNDVSEEVGKEEFLKGLYRKMYNTYDESFSPEEAFEAILERATPREAAFLKSLKNKDDLLGNDYPHQALEQLLENFNAVDVSPVTKGLATKAGNKQFK